MKLAFKSLICAGAALVATPVFSEGNLSDDRVFSAIQAARCSIGTLSTKGELDSETRDLLNRWMVFWTKAGEKEKPAGDDTWYARYSKATENITSIHLLNKTWEGRKGLPNVRDYLSECDLMRLELEHRGGWEDKVNFRN